MLTYDIVSFEQPDPAVLRWMSLQLGISTMLISFLAWQFSKKTSRYFPSPGVGGGDGVRKL